MRFVWFWTFWHWSKESFRDGFVLRSPLQGVGSHWDEWFRHEASENDRRAIAETGRSESTQREFIAWIFWRWTRETTWTRHRTVPRFVLGQLAQMSPFKDWTAFDKYRKGYGATGISALVLAEKSRGAPEDVRAVEGIALPADSAEPAVVPEGFQADTAEFEAQRFAAKSLLSGTGLAVFLAFWTICGRRPYPRWLSRTLLLGWITIVGLITLLLLGPEPGQLLVLFSGVLLTLWIGLVSVAAATVVWQGVQAWRTGRNLSTQLELSQVRIRMTGGLTLKGGSAGLAFCLNILLALFRARPEVANGSWIWRRFFRLMCARASNWAATGIVTETGLIKPVVVEPKLRASLQQSRIRGILTPRQPGADRRTVARLARELKGSGAQKGLPQPVSPGLRLGYAAELPILQIHRCRHVGQSIMALGEFFDRRQIVANGFALVVSTTMLIAAPDLRSILAPYPAPVAVPPASTSPYSIWVSLDTQHPEYFGALLESGYWSNRRVEVNRYGGVTSSIRAEIQLHRLTGMKSASEEDGVVWIERRRRFLGREYYPGERVGRYSIPYLSRLGHE